MNFDFSLVVLRTGRRKTASIQVIGNVVKVTVSDNLSDKRIQDLILKRMDWIKRKIKIQSAMDLPRPKKYVNRESFTYLGQNYRLKIVSQNSDGVNGVKIKNGYLEVPAQKDLFGNTREENIRDALEKWYLDCAFGQLVKKTRRYARQLGVRPQSVKVQYYKSRWGSCSVSGNISYNWRIIMAPHRIVDYVVVHELCHLLEYNHSPRYWNYVENAMPSFKECREWLKVNGNKLFI